MEYPGFLGEWLYSLREWMQRSPLGSLGPLMGFIAADLAVDWSRRDFGSLLIELIIAPILATAIVSVAAGQSSSLAGPLLVILGAVSIAGAGMLLSLGLLAPSGLVTMTGLRHLAVGVYALAAVASEPRRRTTVPSLGW